VYTSAVAAPAGRPEIVTDWLVAAAGAASTPRAPAPPARLVTSGPRALGGSTVVDPGSTGAGAGGLAPLTSPIRPRSVELQKVQAHWYRLSVPLQQSGLLPP